MTSRVDKTEDRTETAAIAVGVRAAPEGGNTENTVKLWDAQSGEELQTLSGHSGQVSDVAFSPDGSFLASGSFDETVKLWTRVEDER